MAKADTWMPLYIGDYLADTMHLTTTQHGAYLLLIMACWKSGGPLPDQDANLAAAARMALRDWKSARPTIAPFFQIVAGEWRHKRVDTELVAAAANHERRTESARRAADARWNANRNAPRNAPRMPDALPEDMRKECPPPSPSDESPSGASSHDARAEDFEEASDARRPRASRRTRISPDWQPDKQDRAFAAGLGLDPDAVAAEFRDFWVGDGRPKADWSATFRNRCREVAGRRPRGNAPAGGGAGGGGVVASANRVLAALERSKPVER